MKIEKLLFSLGRLFLRLGYRLRAYKTRKAYRRISTEWSDEKEQRYQLAIKQIRVFRDIDLLAGIGVKYQKV